MVKKSDLPLVDAMNSIELFNPKMDTGMVASSSSSNRQEILPSDFKYMSQRLFDPHRDFRPEEILWIMDEMLAAEVDPLPYHSEVLTQSR
jgi:hypothetical protein